MTSQSRATDLERIECALTIAATVIKNVPHHLLEVDHLSEHHPVTFLDKSLDAVLRAILPRGSEGWLSEESRGHDAIRHMGRVWIVDAVDGTRELIANIPEWTVSIGLVEGRQPVAGGVLNPWSQELFLGSIETGVSSACAITRKRQPRDSETMRVLVSRKEFDEIRGRLLGVDTIDIVPKGSIAYRLALVAAGQADVACTFQFRHEWDVAAGVALVHAAGGQVVTLNGKPLQFGSDDHRLNGICAFSETCRPETKKAFIHQLQ